MTNNESSAYTTNPRLAKQFATRKDAVAAAVSIRWRRSDVMSVDVMGFKLWVVADDHCRMLTSAGLGALVDAIAAEHAYNFKAERGQHDLGCHMRDESREPGSAKETGGRS